MIFVGQRSQMLLWMFRFLVFPQECWCLFWPTVTLANGSACFWALLGVDLEQPSLSNGCGPTAAPCSGSWANPDSALVWLQERAQWASCSAGLPQKVCITICLTAPELPSSFLKSVSAELLPFPGSAALQILATLGFSTPGQVSLPGSPWMVVRNLLPERKLHGYMLTVLNAHCSGSEKSCFVDFIWFSILFDGVWGRAHPMPVTPSRTQVQVFFHFIFIYLCIHFIYGHRPCFIYFCTQHCTLL